MPQGSYSLALSGSLTDFAGNDLASALPHFVYDNRGPTPVLASPADRSFDAPLEGDVALTFSEPIFSNAPSDLRILVQRLGSTVQSLSARIDGHTLRATLARSLQINTTYTLAVEGSLRDAVGNGVFLFREVSAFTTIQGPFAPPVDYAGTQQVRSLTAADIDGDGRPEIVYVVPTDSVGTDHLLMARSVASDGTVGPPRSLLSLGASCTELLATGDFDGDGRTDFVTCGSVQLQRGGSSFAVERPSFLRPLSRPTVADLGRDGRSDMVEYVEVPGGPSGAFHWSVWSRDPDGTWRPSASMRPSPGSGPLQWSLHDMNQDGLPDLVWTQSGQAGMELWWARGGTFTGFGSPLRIEDIPAPTTEYAVVDLDGDGVVDLVAQGLLAPTGPTVRWYRGLGGGRFAAAVTIQALVPNWSGQRFVADVDGNRRVDLVMGSGTAFWVVRSPSDGAFEVSVPFTLRRGGPLVLADIDGDGLQDVVTPYDVMLQRPWAGPWSIQP